MTKTELLDRVSAAELTEWMGLWTLRNRELKEAESAGPPTKNIQQPKVRRR